MASEHGIDRLCRSISDALWVSDTIAQAYDLVRADFPDEHERTIRQYMQMALGGDERPLERIPGGLVDKFWDVLTLNEPRPDSGP